MVDSGECYKGLRFLWRGILPSAIQCKLMDPNNATDADVGSYCLLRFVVWNLSAYPRTSENREQKIR